MRFEEVAEAVRGVPFMTPEHGRRVYDHVRATRPAQVLELGTAHGVSAAYLAAALEAEGGEGRVTTVDYAAAAFDPAPADVLARAGLAHRVTVVKGHSSYTWWLKEQVQARADGAGNVEPAFDFCYLDGSKNLNVDGLAVVLVEKLLRPGGWLLMDDLEWTYRRNPWIEPAGDGRPLGPLSDAERDEPHLRAVFELVVKGLPSFTRLAVEDEWYGWAQKAPGAPRRLELRSSKPLSAVVATGLRRLAQRRGLR